MSYLLMLLIMTFNIWIMLSIVVGAGVGYLCCGWTQIILKHGTKYVRNRAEKGDKDSKKRELALLELESNL
jgi:hypothetical protein